MSEGQTLFLVMAGVAVSAGISYGMASAMRPSASDLKYAADKTFAEHNDAAGAGRRWWYCQAGDPYNPGGGLSVFSTCVRDPDACIADGDQECVATLSAWCGNGKTCTFTRKFCEDVGAGENGKCHLTKP